MKRRGGKRWSVGGLAVPVGVAWTVVTACAGCGGAPPPVDQLATTQAAIRAAQEAGATEDPQGRLHLKLAEEQVAKGKALMDDDDNERAMRLLQRAEADAQLAHALAKKRAVAAEAADAVKDVQDLHKGK